MKDILLYIAAAFFEIFGCFAFWNHIRLNKSWWWLVPGIVSLLLFAFVLAKVEAEFAGRAYAIYGGIYIAASLLWLYFAEHHMPDKWDIAGALISIVGALIILFHPR